MEKTIAFLGAGGRMGSGMAKNLHRNGFAVRAWNRTADNQRFKELGREGITCVSTIKDAVKEVRIVGICVSRPEDVKELLFGREGVTAHAPACALIIDFSTIGSCAAEDLAAELSKSGLRFLDAPVSGGDVGAQNGTLTIMVGGAAEDYAAAQHVFSAIGKVLRHCGPIGSGQNVKAINQLLCAANTIAVAEALLLAKESGIDPQLIIDICSTGAAGSWSLQNLGPRILASDFTSGFTAGHLEKDLGFVRELANNAKLRLPSFELSEQLYKRLGKLPTEAKEPLASQAVTKALSR